MPTNENEVKIIKELNNLPAILRDKAVASIPVDTYEDLVAL
jgi:hypothetical protein